MPLFCHKGICFPTFSFLYKIWQSKSTLFTVIQTNVKYHINYAFINHKIPFPVIARTQKIKKLKTDGNKVNGSLWIYALFSWQWNLYLMLHKPAALIFRNLSKPTRRNGRIVVTLLSKKLCSYLSNSTELIQVLWETFKQHSGKAKPFSTAVVQLLILIYHYKVALKNILSLHYCITAHSLLQCHTSLGNEKKHIDEGQLRFSTLFSCLRWFWMFGWECTHLPAGLPGLAELLHFHSQNNLLW